MINWIPLRLNIKKTQSLNRLMNRLLFQLKLINKSNRLNKFWNWELNFLILREMHHKTHFKLHIWSSKEKISLLSTLKKMVFLFLSRKLQNWCEKIVWTNSQQIDWFLERTKRKRNPWTKQAKTCEKEKKPIDWKEQIWNLIKKSILRVIGVAYWVAESYFWCLKFMILWIFKKWNFQIKRYEN